MKNILKRMFCFVLCMILINVQGIIHAEASSKVDSFKNSRVQNFHLSSLSGNHISLEWDSLKGATGYTLLRSKEKNGDYLEDVTVLKK